MTGRGNSRKTGGNGSGALKPLRKRLMLAGTALAALLAPRAALAETSLPDPGLASSGFSTPAFSALGINALEAVSMVTVSGLALFSLIAAAALIRARRRDGATITHLRATLDETNRKVDWLEALSTGDDSLALVFTGGDNQTVLHGAPSAVRGIPDQKGALLQFRRWLPERTAATMEAAIRALRETGEAFSLDVTGLSGYHMHVSGRAYGASTIVRFRGLSGAREKLATAEDKVEHLTNTIDTLHALLDASPTPAWIRGIDGTIIWANKAYAHALDLENGDQAVEQGLNLLDEAARREAAQVLEQGEAYTAELPLVIDGQRRAYTVIKVKGIDGSAGMAVDASQAASLRADLRHAMEFHARTLNQLQTAVAIFGADQRLIFSNAAFGQLFDLPQGLLDQHPDQGTILDTMRAKRQIPEQADFKSWKTDHLEAYRALEPVEDWWYLPDDRTLRVVGTPHPHGGVTWIYEDITDRMELESRFNSMSRVQGETLDSLREGVVVFGSDGRLKLNNPAFATIWNLPESSLSEANHISAIIGACRPLAPQAEAWDRIMGVVTGFGEGRESLVGRLEMTDGRILDYLAVPLPDGATMLTFDDVTASVSVERALKDRNDALEEAGHVKNAFIEHVSYELRSPLTSVIGFAQLLGDESTGALNQRQRDYLDYILSSSSALLALVNDILDLATLDAGILKLDLEQMDVRATIVAACGGLQDRLSEKRISIEVDAPDDLGMVVADEKRIRQVLFNLISNAVSFSPDGATVTVSARNVGGDLHLSVTDHGCGMPAAFIHSAFERFETGGKGAGSQGAGLGLPLVKAFIELHGGAVAIDSKEGVGTTVTCTLPQLAKPGA